MYCGTLPRTKNTTSNMTGPREQLLSGQGRDDSGLDRDSSHNLVNCAVGLMEREPFLRHTVVRNPTGRTKLTVRLYAG